MEMRSTVFVVDDDPAICDSLQCLLESAGFDVEAYQSGQRFLDFYAPTPRSCLLLDVKMPRMNGLELQQLILERGIKIPVIFLTAHADVPMAVNALKTGAIDLIEKPFADYDLIHRINAALDAAVDSPQTPNTATVASRIADLTERERQILDRLVAGRWVKAIAAELGTSPNTVRNQRTQILRKMRVNSIAELIRIIMAARLERSLADHEEDLTETPES